MFELDLGDRVAIVTGAATRHGRLDVMANVAGIGATGTPMTTDEAELDHLWAANFKSVFYGTHGVARACSSEGPAAS